MLPELTFGEHVTLPAFYGKNCVTGLGLRNSFYFRYEQPELISTKEEFIKGLGSVKVQWNFAGNKIGCEFAYTVKTAGHPRQIPLRARDRRPALEIPRGQLAFFYSPLRRHRRRLWRSC
jgi:hypothetical protein